jgi:hypothetical protein
MLLPLRRHSNVSFRSLVLLDVPQIQRLLVLQPENAYRHDEH